MALTPLKTKLGEVLRGYVVRSGRRQLEFAAALNVTSSAVSQMLSGRITPSYEQLVTFSTLMALSKDEFLEVVTMANLINSGTHTLRSNFNQFFTLARCERGVDTQRLAYLTGISVSRLDLLEKSHVATPTFEEIRQLAPVLGCSEVDMLVAAGLYTPGAVAAADSGAPRAAEAATPYVGADEAAGGAYPVVDFPHLDGYRASESILAFATRNATTRIGHGFDFSVPVVVVRATGRELKIGCGGEVLLFVADQRPDGYRMLELVRTRDRKCRLRERHGGTWKFFQLPGGAEPSGHVIWSLPVLEMVIRPLRPRANQNP